MKFSALALAVIVALLGLSLFSAFAMSPMTMEDHEASPCLASTALQTPCPETSSANSFAVVNLHSNFITGFSTAIFVGSLTLLALALLVLLYRLFGGRASAFLRSASGFAYFLTLVAVVPALAHMRAWYSLLEHSPTFAFARLS